MNVNDTWVGVVEDRKDPAGTGRLKVRIVGIHPQDTSLVPTSALPYAQAEASVATAHLFSGPKEGDWVTGYFINGDRQHPMVTGVSSGLLGRSVRIPNQNANVIRTAINSRFRSDTRELNSLQRQFSNLSINPSGKNLIEIAKLSLKINLKQLSVNNLSSLRTNLNNAYSKRLDVGFVDNRSIKEINEGAKVPSRWDKYAPDFQAGQPTIPQYARGIVIGSANQYSVRNRAHVCDIALSVRHKLGQAAFAISASTAIREAIKKLIEAIGINPVSAFVADTARKIAGFLKKVLKILKMVNRYVKEVIRQVFLIKAVIEFIRALPDYLKKLFDRCLREIFRELATFVFDLVSDAFPDTATGLGDTFTAIGEAVTDAVQVFDAANQTLALGKQLLVALDPESKTGFSPAQTERIIAEEFPDYVPIREQVLGRIL